MKLFLVRHAKTRDHKERWPAPDTPLDEVGEKQARVLGKLTRFSSVDVVLSSEWERAKKTAKIVAESIDKPLETLDFIHERKQHSKIYGADRKSKISREYGKQAIDNYTNLDWKFKDDEESLREVVKRAERFRKYLLKEYREKTVLAFSHSVFIRSFVASSLLGKEFDDRVFNRILIGLSLANTGVSLLFYYDKREYWRLIYFDDFSHLKRV